jgi:hypothetical protein
MEFQFLKRTGRLGYCIHCGKLIHEYAVTPTENGWESSNGSDFCSASIRDSTMHEIGNGATWKRF